MQLSLDLPNLFPMLVSLLLAVTNLFGSPPYRSSSVYSQFVQEYRLTPAQVKRITRLNDDYDQRLNRSLQTTKRLEQELTDLIFKKSSDQRMIDRKREQLKAAQNELSTIVYEKFFKLREVLTAEQLQKFVTTSAT